MYTAPYVWDRFFYDVAKGPPRSAHRAINSGPFSLAIVPRDPLLAKRKPAGVIQRGLLLAYRWRFLCFAGPSFLTTLRPRLAELLHRLGVLLRSRSACSRSRGGCWRTGGYDRSRPWPHTASDSAPEPPAGRRGHRRERSKRSHIASASPLYSPKTRARLPLRLGPRPPQFRQQHRRLRQMTSRRVWSGITPPGLETPPYKSDMTRISPAFS